MIVTNLYSLYDRVSDSYGPVFEAVNDATAVRSLSRLLRDVNPSDYELHCVGYRTEFKGTDEKAPKMIFILGTGEVHDYEVPSTPYEIPFTIRRSKDNAYSIAEVVE
nr:MAG: nonstructural protein [Microvirus sp.]